MEELKIYSLDEVPELATIVLQYAASRRIVAFYGPMGAGKTTLIKEICRQLGVEDIVTSPTFALVNQYEAGDGGQIYHFDFYRIEDPSEAFDLGYEEYFDSGGLCLIEWPEKIKGLLPEDTLKIIIEPDPDRRQARTISIQ